MTTGDRLHTPLLERHGLRQQDRPKEAWTNVPDAVSHFLRDWCYEVLTARFDLLYETRHEDDALILKSGGFALAQSLSIELPSSCAIEYDEWMAAVASDPDPLDIILGTADNDNDQLLNVADYLIASGLASTDAVTSLRRLLTGSYSAWQVNHDDSALVLRVLPELRESFRQAISLEDSSAAYLAIAWDAALRRNEPSAVEAYDAAVKAIESILIPIVIPKDPTPTLGKVLRALKARPKKWNTRFQGEDTVKALTALLDELWTANSRHAGMPSNDLEQAQDAVTIAVAVVALVRRGFLTRVDDS